MDQDAITRGRDCAASAEAADAMTLILERYFVHTAPPQPARAQPTRWCGPKPASVNRGALDVVTMRTPYAARAAVGA